MDDKNVGLIYRYEILAAWLPNDLKKARENCIVLIAKLVEERIKLYGWKVTPRWPEERARQQALEDFDLPPDWQPNAKLTDAR